jgi:flagellar assembly protein FliH
MSSSPDRVRELDAVVLRGDGARQVAAASFDVDLRTAVPAPGGLSDAARAAAHATGYADGWAKGQRAARLAARAAADRAAAAERAAEQARTAALERAVAAVGRAAAALAAREAQALAEVQDVVLAAAVDVAEAILGHELSHAPDGPLAAVRRALSATPDGGPVTVRLHPDDHAALVGADGSAYAVEGRTVSLVPDPALDPGDAVATSGASTVDATLAAAVARVREVLAR